MAFYNPGLSVDQAKALPGLRAYSGGQGIYTADDGAFYQLDEQGGVRATRNVGDFGTSSSTAGGPLPPSAPSPSPQAPSATAASPSTTAAPTTTVAPSGNYQQAVSYLQGKLGRTLSEQDIAAAFAKFGGDKTSTFTEAGLAPVLAYFQGQGGNPQTPTLVSGSGPTTPTGTYTPAGRGPNGETLFKGPDGKTYAQGFEGYVLWNGGGNGGGSGPTDTGPAGGGNGGIDDILKYLRDRDAARTAQNETVTQGMRDSLLRIMRDNQGTPSITDPSLAGQADAYHVANRRGVSETRAAMAERAANQGLLMGGQSSGSFDAGLQSIEENAGQHEASFNAGLVGQEVQARRTQLMQALQIADALGARTEAESIQTQLGSLDAILRQQAITTQGSLGRGQLGLGFLSTLLGNQTNNDRLGFDYAQLIALLNRQGLLAGMG